MTVYVVQSALMYWGPALSLDCFQRDVKSWRGKDELGIIVKENATACLTRSQIIYLFRKNSVSRDRSMLFQNIDYIIFGFGHMFTSTCISFSHHQ